ncbi:MAG: hypothetical protein JST04_16220 [Bdellovibrionales bacterium]|nr:hypothetical protein [Bdellovibrionales bacterium]
MAIRPGSKPKIRVLSGFLLGFLAAAGCSKSGGPSAPKTELADATPARTELPNPAGKCDSANTTALLADIARAEAEKSALEKTAKESPAKANFRKLYDAELAFTASTEEKAGRLAECGAAPDTLAEVKNKIAKSRANVTYLSESFPDFK